MSQKTFCPSFCRQMKNGLWHIIDYKTNAGARDLADEYVSQLDAYIKAFKSLTGNYSDAGIYHIAV